VCGGIVAVANFALRPRNCRMPPEVDAAFAYHVKCPDCNTVYMCNGYIELIELEDEPESCVIEGSFVFGLTI
jgi:hypothetical protein